MDSSHKPLHEAELLIDNLDQGSDSVRGARCVGHHVRRAVVFLLVDPHHVHRGISGRSRDDDFFGSAAKMCFGFVDRREDAGGLDDVLGSSFVPGNAGGVFLGVELHLAPLDGERAFVLGDFVLEAAVGGIIFEHVLLWNNPLSIHRDVETWWG